MAENLNSWECDKHFASEASGPQKNQKKGLGGNLKFCGYGPGAQLDQHLTKLDIRRTLQKSDIVTILVDCTKLDPAWNNVVTEPALPVVHSTTLKLDCPGGYTNLGGGTATCQYGQVINTDKPPDCRGKSHVIDHTRYVPNRKK